MSTVAPEISSEPPSLAARAAEDILNVWSRAFDEFRDRELREMIHQAPGAAELAAHVRELKAMIRLTHLLYAQVSDPDFPARQRAGEVKGALLLLEDSLKMLTNPIRAEEADRILGECFPDAPRA